MWLHKYKRNSTLKYNEQFHNFKLRWSLPIVNFYLTNRVVRRIHLRKLKVLLKTLFIILIGLKCLLWLRVSSIYWTESNVYTIHRLDPKLGTVKRGHWWEYTPTPFSNSWQQDVSSLLVIYHTGLQSSKSLICKPEVTTKSRVFSQTKKKRG